MMWLLEFVDLEAKQRPADNLIYFIFWEEIFGQLPWSSSRFRASIFPLFPWIF